MTYFDDYRGELTAALATIDVTLVERMRELLVDARANGRTIFTCGNGGSASTASHFATDLLKGASYERDQRFKVVALTDATSSISAYSNDVSYDIVYEEQLRNFLQPDDLVVAISGSGNSTNVIRALTYASSVGAHAIAMTGRDGGELGKAATLHINVAEQHMGRIEDAHLAICHMLAFSFIDTES
ncbi:MAG: SIS domain-containing protein [Microbacteriaceae bacterium]|nr:SIS domain-containing protein [Microbacteriaceae bacterium]